VLARFVGGTLRSGEEGEGILATGHPIEQAKGSILYPVQAA
jgi:hypothetical protein